MVAYIIDGLAFDSDVIEFLRAGVYDHVAYTADAYVLRQRKIAQTSDVHDGVGGIGGDDEITVFGRYAAGDECRIGRTEQAHVGILDSLSALVDEPAYELAGCAPQRFDDGMSLVVEADSHRI